MAEAITTERFGGIKEAFQILTDCPRVEVYADPEGDKVVRTQSSGRRNVSWRVGMKVGDGHWAELHEMGHVIFDSFGGAERFLDKLGNKRTQTIWNTAEDVRIERLAQRHFDKPIWRHHRKALIDQAESYGMKSLDNLVHMVQGLLYDLPLPLAGNETERKALEYFKDDLIASTRSKDSADTAKVAIRIAHYMDWLDEVSAPPKPPEPTIPTDEPGDDDGDDTKSGDDPSGRRPDSSSDEERDDPPTGFTGSGTKDHDSESVPEVSDDDVVDVLITDTPSAPVYDESSEGDLLDMLGKASKSIQTSDRRAEKYELNKREKALQKLASKGHRITYGFDDGDYKAEEDDHAIRMLEWQAEDIVLSDASRFVLENAESVGASRSRYTGRPSRKAWRLTYGDAKVFRKPPKHKGKLVCLVDMSGSMGCHCERHNREDRDTHGEPVRSNGWMAWQTVAVLSSRFPDLEVFGFTSSISENFIVPVPSRQQPDCLNRQARRGETGGGNADCASLLWLDSYLGLFASGSSAIVISDGMPAGPFPLRCGCASHTRDVAKMMADKGVSYASVLIRTYDGGLYPNELTTTIDEVDDIRNLQEVLDWISQK